MLKRVQHENRVWICFSVIPNRVLNLLQDLAISGSLFLALRIWVLKPRPYMGGVLYFSWFSELLEELGYG